MIWLHDFTPTGAVFLRSGDAAAIGRMPARSPERLYRAVRRIENDREIGRDVFVVDGGQTHALAPRFDLARHSPDGFNWSYAGSGPAQLALAILADALNDDGRALALYQAFKFDYIARCDRAGFEISAARVCEMAEAIEAARARA